jgi:para-nitrobenzyl esterase
MMIRLFALSLAALAVACASLPALAQPVVQAPAGTVSGQSVDGVDAFRGIPYAQAPTGWRRWKPPAALSPWRGTREAVAFGPACHQPVARGTSIYAAAEAPKMSEDCLSLNIWRPQGAEKAPVFVWIHGGSLMYGSSSETMYDGARMAASQGMVVVTINYRLGVLGWLAHPELSAESRGNVSGNYGLMDQVAALKWVQANIAAFGGDPDNVTIAGESAGALSVMYLMASPEARGLFHRAVAQSAYMISTPELRSSRYGDVPAEGLGFWLQGKLGRAGLAEMRAMDAQELTVAAQQAGYAPFGTIDGAWLPEQLVTVFDRGEQAQVPVLIGFNDGEIRSLRFLIPPSPPTGAAAYEAAIRERYGDLADTFLRLYPSDDIPESLMDTQRDGLYGWTAERLARRQTRLGEGAYLYFFDHGYPAADDAGLHAFHAVEIPYVFSAMDKLPPLWPAPPDTAQERALSDAMMAYWGSFARAGVPTAPGQPDWPAYGATEAYMLFDGTPQPGRDLMPGMFEMQEAVVCRRVKAGGMPWNWNFGVIAPTPPPAATGCP